MPSVSVYVSRKLRPRLLRSCGYRARTPALGRCIPNQLMEPRVYTYPGTIALSVSQLVQTLARQLRSIKRKDLENDTFAYPVCPCAHLAVLEWSSTTSAGSRLAS